MGNINQSPILTFAVFTYLSVNGLCKQIHKSDPYLWKIYTTSQLSHKKLSEMLTRVSGNKKSPLFSRVAKV